MSLSPVLDVLCAADAEIHFSGEFFYLDDSKSYQTQNVQTEAITLIQVTNKHDENKTTICLEGNMEMCPGEVLKKAL